MGTLGNTGCIYNRVGYHFCIIPYRGKNVQKEREITLTSSLATQTPQLLLQLVDI